MDQVSTLVELRKIYLDIRMKCPQVIPFAFPMRDRRKTNHLQHHELRNVIIYLKVSCGLQCQRLFLDQ